MTHNDAEQLDNVCRLADNYRLSLSEFKAAGKQFNAGNITLVKLMELNHKTIVFAKLLVKAGRELKTTFGGN